MTPEPDIGMDTIEREIESVLKPRTFIQDDACFSFVNRVETVAAKVAELIGIDPMLAASQYTNPDPMRFVPECERPAWHSQALDTGRGTDLYALIDLLIASGETSRLADPISGTASEALRAAGHLATEPAAQGLEDTHPGLAARLWRAQGLRIVEAGKSKYYEAAVANFARAKGVSSVRTSALSGSPRCAVCFRATIGRRHSYPDSEQWLKGATQKSRHPSWNAPSTSGGGGTGARCHETENSCQTRAPAAPCRSRRTGRADHGGCL
jgi:hypothetical protein